MDIKLMGYTPAAKHK